MTYTMKPLPTTLLVLACSIASSLAQMSSSATFNPGNGSLGGTYALTHSSILTQFVPELGSVQPTGASDHTFQAGPTAGTYYYSPVKQFFITVRDPGNGNPPYIRSMIEFAVNGEGNPTSTTREIALDSSGNFEAGDASTFPEFNPTGYSMSWEGGGFGPSYGSAPPNNTASTPPSDISVAINSLNTGLDFENGTWVPSN